MRRLVQSLRDHPQIRRRPSIAQFVKFSLVGASNTLIDFLLYALLTRAFHWHYLPANVFSFSVAATWSYTLNRRWTFRDRTSRIRRQYPKFFLVAVIGLGLTSLFLAVFIDLIGLHDLIAKAITVVLVTFWNFSANRTWTFRPPALAR